MYIEATNKLEMYTEEGRENKRDKKVQNKSVEPEPCTCTKTK